MTEVYLLWFIFLYHHLPLSPIVLIFPEKIRSSFKGCLIATSVLALTVLQAAGRRCINFMSAKWRRRFLKQSGLAQLHCSQWEYAGFHQQGLQLLWLMDWITFIRSVPSLRLDLLLPNSEESASTQRKQITWTP